MKVLYVLNATTMHGGGNKSFLSMLDTVLDHDVEAAVLCPDTDGIYRHLKAQGIETYALPYRYNILPSHTPLAVAKYAAARLLDLKAAKTLTRMCREDIQPDILHTNTTVSTVGYHAAQWLGLPHVWHIREYGQQDFNYDIPFADAWLKARGNHAIAITRGLARARGIEQARVIYNGVLPEAQSLVIRPRGNYFLYAGRVEAAKGVDMAVEAFMDYCREFPDDGVTLKIAGSENQAERQYVERLKSCGNTRIEWLGQCDDVKELMAEARAVIVPSRCEAFGRVAPEAMAAGALVMGRDTGGMAEQMDNGLHYTGQEIALRFTDAQGLAKQMADVARKGSEHYLPMVERAFATVKHFYTIEANGREVVRLYDEIMATRR